MNLDTELNFTFYPQSRVEERANHLQSFLFNRNSKNLCLTSQAAEAVAVSAMMTGAECDLSCPQPRNN